MMFVIAIIFKVFWFIVFCFGAMHAEVTNNDVRQEGWTTFARLLCLVIVIYQSIVFSQML